jgi:hypothetical protein
MRHVILILLSVLLAVGFVTAQSCSIPAVMRFKPNSDPFGARSYISEEGLPVNYTKQEALPPVAIQLLVDNMDGTFRYDFTLDGVTVTAALEPSFRLGGNAVEVRRGEAVFDALTLQEEPAANQAAPVLVFTLTTPTGLVRKLTTGRTVAIPKGEQQTPSVIRFANAGFFTREGQRREIPTNPVALPVFSLEVVNGVGSVITPSVSLTVQAQFATVTPSVLSSTEVDRMVVTATGGGAPVISIIATLGSWSSTISSGPLTPVTLPLRNKFMLFTADSSISRENAGTTAVMGVPLRPVKIQLYTSALVPDTSATGLIITASTPQGTLSGAEALVVRGVATFSELMFVGEAPRSAVITFTAGTQGNHAVAGATLSSGLVTVSVSAVKAKYLTFASFSQVTTQDMFLESSSRDFVIDSVVVQVRDSAYQLDSTANDITLTLYPTEGSASATGTSALDVKVSNGIAVWSGLSFALLTPPVELEVKDPSTAAGDSARKVRSGRITVAANPLTATAKAVSERARALLLDCRAAPGSSCIFSLKFASQFGTFSSSVYQEDLDIVTTIGGFVPTIVVELRDQFGVSTSFPDDVPLRLVAYTGSDPDAESLLNTEDGANFGSWQNGRWYLSCLQFVNLPKRTVRIRFMAYDLSVSPHARLEGTNGGAPLMTGFVTVASVPTPNVGLRFAPDQSLIAYPGQRSSAVLNVALPPITIELLDSVGQYDSTDSSVVIVATTSSGQLDAFGSMERVTAGRATFNGLKFTRVVEEPRLTFTAFQTRHPVAGRSISTGQFLVTALPITDYDIAFLDYTSVNNDVNYAFKTFIFQNLSEATVRASIVIVDSAHQRKTVSLNTFYIRPSSEQATLDAAELKSIGPRTACACANFTNRITGYKDGYSAGTPIYITYTVTDGTGLLRGKAITVGPISVGELQQNSKSCAANLIAPAVIAEFRTPIDSFSAASVKANLAFTMAIESSRVVIRPDSVKSISRVDYSNMNAWDGTRAVVTFGDPLPTSTNRKTSAQLAATFVGLRPQCDANSLNLDAVYFEEDDRSCDTTAFAESMATTKACVEAGIMGECQCYDLNVIAHWGTACYEDPALQADFSSLCNTLKDCAEAEVQKVCQKILASQETSLVWLWALLGSLGGVIIILIILRQKGILRAPKKASLNSNKNAD